MKYTHLKLDDEQRFLAGYYVPLKEIRMPSGSREVLYVVGQATLDSACCSAGTFAYVIVPGYVVKWQSEANAEGLPVTEVEPVSDEATRNDLRKLIHEAENISHIDFW